MSGTMSYSIRWVSGSPGTEAVSGQTRSDHDAGEEPWVRQTIGSRSRSRARYQDGGS